MRFALNKKKNPSEEEQPSGAGDRKKRSFNKWNQLLFSKLNEPWRRCGNTALISWQSSRLKLALNLLINSMIEMSLLANKIHVLRSLFVERI